MKKRTNQSAEDIVVLRGLESVWQNPARFIGDVSTRGMHHLVDEIVSNSIDEAMSGYASSIDVVLHADNVVSIQDNGRGIPTELHPSEKISTLELVLTTLDAGGKMQKKAYEYSGGLHGVGLSVVNALCEFLEVEVRRNSKKYYQRYEYGKPIGKVKLIGNSKKTGTKITFKPDPKYFTNTLFKPTIISNKLKELSYINSGIKFSFYEEGSEKEVFNFDEGLLRYLKDLNVQRQVLPKEPLSFSSEIVNEEVNDKLCVEFAWQYCDLNTDKVKTYANSINTVEGGTHESGFRMGFTKAVNDIIENKLKNKKLDGIYIREGLSAIISIKLRKPEFESQTKTKLTNLWVRSYVSKFVYDSVYDYLSNNNSLAREVFNKASLSSKAAQAAKRAKALVKRKSLLETITTLPGKIADCEVKDASRAELFIVEGDSAGGSAKQGRNRKYQAILPLKGKILNVERKGVEEVLKNEEIKAIIQALGCGMNSSFSIDKLRYNKIIIMTDADSDGSHIRNLLLTFFYRLMPDLIKKGHLYIAQAPLYKVKYDKKIKYIKNDTQLNKLLLSIVKKSFAIYADRKNRIEKEELIEIFSNIINYNSMYSYISNNKSKLIIDYFLRFTNIRAGSIEDESNVKLLKEEINSYIPLLKNLYPLISPINIKFLKDEENNFCFKINSISSGRELETVFDYEFFSSPEFKNIEHYFKKFKTLGKPPYYVELDSKVHKVSDIFSLHDLLLELSKSKLEIQRYKGLGEMNPDQLWETTMNPSSRTVLKVDIDDIDAADALTYTLMGDSSSSRKSFIDHNALKAKNVDI